MIRNSALSLALFVLVLSVMNTAAQTTSFTYQGRLTDTSALANGTYDFQIALFDALSGGAQIGTTQTITGVTVTTGTFTVLLDFGAAAFPGADRFLEIRVKRAVDPTYTTLTPRQKVTSTPYSIRAADADKLDGVDSTGFIRNQTTQQTADLNINGTATASIVSAATQFNIGGNRVLSVAGSNNVFAGVNAGANSTGDSNSFFGRDAGASASNMGNDNSFFGRSAGGSNTTGSDNSFFGSFAGATNTTGFENSFFGRRAGLVNTTGVQNSFFGANAGAATTTGGFNSFFGRNAGQANTTGQANSFFGLQAGFSNTEGINNSFVGVNAGFSNTTGNSNSFVGRDAGYSNTTGNDNAFFGLSAGQNNTTGSNNTFVGKGAGQANTTGSINSFFGRDAGFSNTTGINNSFVGVSAGFSNTTGGSNSYVGVFAGYFNTTGFENSFFGRSAGQNNTTGNNNSFVGTNAGLANTEGIENSFVGAFAGFNNTFGSFNSFFGRGAGQGNTTGNFNSFFGRNAGLANTTAGANSFFGESAGYNNTTGFNNSFFGRSAGQNNTTGERNSFFGTSAGGSNTTGFQNSFFGELAGQNNTTGTNNSFFGRNAGETNTTGSNNTVIGSSAKLMSNNLVYATAIGADAEVAASNTVVLGRSLDTVRIPGTLVANLPAGDAGYIQNRTSVQASSNFNISGNGFIGGNVGIGTTTPSNKLDVNGGITAIGVTSNSLSSTSSLFLNSASGGRIAMRTSGGSGTFERMTILDNGNVGIGVTNPTIGFDVFNQLKVDASGTVSVRLLTASSTEEICYNRGTDPGILVTCSSSLRYKTNVRAFAPGMSFVNQLRPISFDWKDGGQHDVGFGAEDVEQIDRRFVFYNYAGQVEGVRYNRLTAVFVNAFKEQQAQIERQQKQIEALTRLVCLQSPEAEICRKER